MTEFKGMLENLRDRWGVVHDSGELPAQVLAYLGDAVYEMYVRLRLVEEGPSRVDYIHKRAVCQVRAESQASVLEKLLPMLNPDEALVARRGRNMHTQSRRRANGAAHSRSSAFEALLGYLFLEAKYDRLQMVLDFAYGQVCI
jgi:ribonuclease-3 family protein